MWRPWPGARSPLGRAGWSAVGEVRVRVRARGVAGRRRQGRRRRLRRGTYVRRIELMLSFQMPSDGTFWLQQKVYGVPPP